jgi:cephalosporin hydroxylase
VGIDKDDPKVTRVEASEENRRIQAWGGRNFAPALSPRALEDVQHGTLRTRYQGRAFIKSPFDVVLYLQLIGQLQPRTVIEIGTYEGGTALWFSDQLRAYGLDGRVVSVDIDPPAPVDDDRVTFLAGDARDLGSVLRESLLAELPRPWLVVEDSAHLFETTTPVLDFFHEHLEHGDYVVVEDGIVADMPGQEYRRYEDGPNRAVAAFLDRHGDAYVIDTWLCDRYGHNVTWAPNAWLRRA